MRILEKLRLRGDVEEAVIVSVALAVFVAGAYVEALEQAFDFLRRFEWMKLDEAVFGAMVAGFASLTLFVRRGQRLKRHMRLHEQAERDVAWLAQHDPLTHLPNRRFLDDLIARTGDAADTDAAAGYAVLAVDLDGFKQINTLVGHAGGDGLLAEVAARLGQVCGTELVVRVGGDEFLVIADRGRVPDPDMLAARIVDSLGRTMETSKVRAQIGACVGFALVPEHSATISKAITFADTALYAAKRAGRGSVTAFEAAMTASLTRRAELEAALRRAVAEGEIVPHYQPLYDLRTGALTGFEALARWKLPGGGMVSPGEFIPLAEEIGVMVELSDSLFKQACADLRCWPAHLRLSFNISPLQLDDRMLSSRILWILDAYDIAPERLQIELTETALIADVERADAMIAELRAAGIRIALDDFGTGYSCLAQLAQVQFDSLKIDRSFVAALETDAGQREIVKAIVALGQGLEIPLTAEGIENAEQIEWLHRLGCDLGQGFLLGRPIPAGEVAALILAASFSPHLADRSHFGTAG